MATLKEIMEGKEWGCTKIRRPHWNDCEYFIPYFISSNHIVYGLNEVILGATYHSYNYVDWELYTEPKKKVRLYQYAYKNFNGDWWMAGTLCKDGRKVKLLTGSEEIKRIDNVFIEVEE